MSLDDLFDEPTLEARLTGASTRLVALLDPAAPLEMPSQLSTDGDADADANAVSHAHAQPGATSTAPASSVVHFPPPPHRQPRRTWLVLGAAAAAALVVGTVVSAGRNSSDSNNSVAAKQRDTTVAFGRSPAAKPAAAPDTAAAASAETTAAPAAAPAADLSPATEGPVAGGLANAPETSAAAASADGFDAASAAATVATEPQQPKRKATSRADETSATPPATVIVPAPSQGAVRTADDPESTFSLDVDTGSYTRLRERIRTGQPVDPNEVRTEELLNYFKQDYPAPRNDAFAIQVDGAAVPFLPADTRVVRVGVQAKQVNDADRKDVSLTFVIDVSGSMEEGGKLELVKSSLITMLDNLRSTDRVAIVAFSDTAWVVLDPTSANQRGRIVNAINTLTPTDSTNAEAGLRLGYQVARRSFGEGRINRVILASDGVANVGPTGPDAIIGEIREQAGKGIQLVTVGVGNGTYNDQMMEQLADKGDGFYTYIDTPQQAFKVFSEKLTGTLQVVALDAKVQVQFDPAKVVAYRLLGYENRAVSDNDFRNDRVDAAEFGAGHTATALYVVQLSPEADGTLGRVQLRWKDPGSNKAKEIGTDISTAVIASEFTNARPRLQQDIYVAAWAEALRGLPWGARADLATLASRVARLGELIPGDPDVAEVVQLIQRSAGYPPPTDVYIPAPPVTVPPVTTLAW